MSSADQVRNAGGNLRKRLTLEQAEAHFAELERDTVALLGHFGGWVKSFREEIVAAMLPGDELWLFDSKPDDWANLCGERGVALVRDGWVVTRIVECRN
jgi:hypothetical protein